MTSALQLRDLAKHTGITYPAVFANGSEGDTFEQRVVDGAKRFKRAVLGRFRAETIISFDEISDALQRLNMLPSARDAKEAIPTLVGSHIPFAVGCAGVYRAMRIEQADEDMYIIGVGTYQ